jgi:hypothetical protein
MVVSDKILQDAKFSTLEEIDELSPRRTDGDSRSSFESDWERVGHLRSASHFEIVDLFPGLVVEESQLEERAAVIIKGISLSSVLVGLCPSTLVPN